MKGNDDNFDFYNVSIVEYLLYIGEPIKKISRNYYQHLEHDSLKINENKNYFVWNSKTGEDNYTGGVVQYLQIMYSLSLHEALKKIQEDLRGENKNFNSKETVIIKQNHKSYKRSQKNFPKHFKYRVKEEIIPIEAQTYLVADRKIPNRIVRHFFSIDLISQNQNKEIIFKWYKKNKIVGFDKQGTVKLTEEQKEKYHYKKDYFKYIAPTTEENTMWGFNYLVGDPKYLFFFESPIDLLSYYSIYEKELLKENNFWLISISGVAIEKVFSFLQYGLKYLELEKHLETLNICFDNDKAGIEALEKLKEKKFKGIDFNDCLPIKLNDWNDIIKNKQVN